MAWTKAEWACGHSGEMQLYGKMTQRYSRVAYESGRDCMACWILDQWEQKDDPRSKREDKFDLACAIAEGKQIRIRG